MSPTGQTTLPNGEITPGRWETALRIGTIAFVTIIVVAAAVGWLGVRTTSVAASGDGFDLTVHYAAVSRPGLATPFSVHVQTSDGAPLPPNVTIRVTSDYLAIFDDNGMEPMPTESHNTAAWTSWTFAVPEGEDTLRVDLDARLEPAVQWQRAGEVELDLGDDRAASVAFITRVSP